MTVKPGIRGSPVRSSRSELDRRYIQLALALAEKGRGAVEPNPLVGCVIVKNGRVVGRGYHRRYGAPHAEVAAIADAGPRAAGAVMYVTLEPCNHYGKTPPCADAVIRAGIRRLVAAAEDPNPVSRCRVGRSRLKAAGIEVQIGIGKAEAMKQNEVYFRNLKASRPLVALKLAATLDAKIADFQGRSQWITSETARKHVHRLRGDYDAIMVGSRTVQTDDPRLTTRIRGQKNPLRVVLDPDLSLRVGASVFRQTGKAIVFCARQVPEAKRKPFLKKGVEVIGVGQDHDGLLVWNQVLDNLHQRGIRSVLVEGGARVASSALQAGIVNRIYIFFAPKILGGGISFTDDLVPRRLSQAIQIKEWHCRPVGDDLLIEGQVSSPPAGREEAG